MKRAANARVAQWLVLLFAAALLLNGSFLSALALDFNSLNPMKLWNRGEEAKATETEQPLSLTKEAEKQQEESGEPSKFKLKFWEKSQSEETQQTLAVEQVPKNQGALIQTERGDIAIELFPEQAPVTVKNFMGLVEKKFYDVPSMTFHRVVPGFVIQAGDPTGTGSGGSGKRIPLEVKNKLSHNAKGIVAMARTADPDSATSQFYITLAPQSSLDGKYAVFGKVVSGMDVLDKIKQGDKLYGIKLIDISTIPPDKKDEKKGIGGSLKNFIIPKS